MTILRTALPARQRGAVLIMYAGVLVVILGFAGLVTDLGLVYLRNVKLQAAADSAALNAAMQLNGTPAGVTTAAELAATRGKHVLNNISGTFNAAGVRFAADPYGPESGWLTADAAAASAATMMYVRIDPTAFAADVRTVQPILLRALGITAAIDLQPQAVAGRRTVGVTPLAICAMGLATDQRGTGAAAELVNYGFRYGVTYNLLMLNTTGAATGDYYLVDPLTPPQAAANAATLQDAVVGPFMCSGTLAYPYAGQGQLHVRKPAAFTLWRQLNTRFEDYDTGANACGREANPPDRNVQSYVGAGNVGWQGYTVTTASAKTAVVDGKLATIADQWPAQTHPRADYGTRWAYNNARNADGSAKAQSSWPTLYPSTTVATYTSFSTSPYMNSTYTRSPTQVNPNRRYRRVMYVPLLSCPVTGNSATVLAYGRFFLTARASATEVPGEFAGVAATNGLVNQFSDAELLQ